MIVFKRGRSWYVDYRVNGKRIMKSFGTHKKVAELYLKDLELKQIRGQLKLVDNSISWREILNRYLQYSKVSKSSATYRPDLCRLRVFNQFLQSRNIIKLSQINPLLMEEFKVLVMGKNSPKTFNHYLDLIRSILNKAVEWNFLSENTLSNFKRLKNHQVRQIRFLTKEEIHRVISLADPFMQNVITLFLYTGLRKSELIYLEWQDIDFKNKILTVQSKPEHGFHPKSYKVRHIPLNSDLEKLLLDLPQCGHYVFDNGENQPLHHPDFYYKNMMRIYKKAGIQEANLHTLRHTFASHLVMSGVDIRTVQELLGHSTVSMTEQYSHLSPLHRTRAVEMLRYDLQVETKRKQYPLSPA